MAEDKPTADPFKPERENRLLDALKYTVGLVGGIGAVTLGMPLIGVPSVMGVVGLLVFIGGYTAALLGFINLLLVITGY